MDVKGVSNGTREGDRGARKYVVKARKGSLAPLHDWLLYLKWENLGECGTIEEAKRIEATWRAAHKWDYPETQIVLLECVYIPGHCEWQKVKIVSENLP